MDANTPIFSDNDIELFMNAARMLHETQNTLIAVKDSRLLQQQAYITLLEAALKEYNIRLDIKDNGTIITTKS